MLMHLELDKSQKMHEKPSKQYSGTKDFLFDCAEQVRKEVPGAMLMICIGVPGTTTILGYTNMIKDDPCWDMVDDIIESFKKGEGNRAS